MGTLTLCSDSAPNFLGLFDTSIAPPLLFYSYIPSILLSLFLGIFVFVKDRHSLSSKTLLWLVCIFSLWALNEIVQWISVFNEVIMFSWQLSAVIGVSLFFVAGYFSFSLIYKKDQPFKNKIFGLILLLPIFLFLSSKANIGAYDSLTCEGVSFGALWIYIYFLEVVLTLWILGAGFKKYVNRQESSEERHKAALTSLAVVAFLISFSFSGIFADLTGIYSLTFYGPLGMVIFLGLLSYIMLEYKVFRVKVLAAQILVAALWILIGSILFVAISPWTRIITSITEILAIIFGIILIRSVKKEVRQREEIEKLAKQLEKANAKLEKTNDQLTAANIKLKDLDRQKTEFLSIASHQLRSPITAIKGYASMLLEGSFGEVAEKAKGAVDVIYQSCQKLGIVIEDFLDITRIELGRMKYAFAPANLREIVESVVKQLLPIAESHGLALSFSAESDKDFSFTADVGKLTQVFANLVDNAIKYTPKGSIAVALSKVKNKYRITVTDTGVGMDEKTRARLFQKFSRADDANKTNADGTGLGLYVAKQLAEAHGGTLRADSPGVGKGSVFTVELPEKVIPPQA